MEKKSPKKILAIIGGVSLIAILSVNVFASVSGPHGPRLHKALAEAGDCLEENVGCTMPDGSAGNKNVCITTGNTTTKCVCGTAQDCQKNTGNQ
ncbi:hypothetical protein [Dinghuibacter silviterrae]|uniref:Uncharacterized protein n=1 Tax=Dinghuibacter silviterrae TaxID=1539049 RepID=A0A4V3GLQ7_9BACT|nr:hypothetical protein [Dinghuibacter silviterrae]TDX00493.1 hypothetical protein EDB95_1518 [Dinghuibacter silviterrae]